MNSRSETGHAKNVANFEMLITVCTGYGAAYNPSKTSIKLLELPNLLAAAQAAVAAVTSAQNAFLATTNARELAFAELKPLATRIVNALAATSTLDTTVDDARSINRKIQGGKAKKITTTDKVEVPPAGAETTTTPGEEEKHISTSQQSYDNQLDNFRKLIDLVTKEASYKPNEADLKVTALNTLSKNMHTRNNNVANALTAVNNARIARDKVLYATDTGLYDVAQAVKKYVKSLFGAGSPEFKQAGHIRFTTHKT